ncbi:MAG: hypothetical protein WCK77_03690 [Verrucomicrobiota bacterium]
MKTSSLVLRVLAATFIASASVHGQKAELATQLVQIRELLKPADADSAEVKRAKATLQGWQTAWQNLLDTDQLAGFSEYGMRNLGADELAAIPDLATKIAAFNNSVKEEIARREAARIAEAEALLARVGDNLKSAKKAEDLDSLVLALSKNKISESGRNPKLSALSRDLQGAAQIVVYWQDYLIAEETGNSQTSHSKLESISSQLGSNPVLPRSLVLRLLNPQGLQPAAAKDGGKAQSRISLDEIQTKLTDSGDSAGALAALKALPLGQFSNSDDGYLKRAVQAVEDLRKLEPAMAESEVFANIRTIQQSGQNQNRYLLARAIDQIALNAIARSYGIEVPSAKVASARNVLETMAMSAKDKQDWPQLRRVTNSLEGLGTTEYTSGVPKRSYDLKILALLELGKAAEQRNDLDAAASAYLEASGIDGQFLQRELGYSKLAALKEKAPDKVAALIAKAEESRQRAEAARYAAEIESRTQMMSNRGMPYERLRSKEELAALRPMIQEVVAEFLKEKRTDLLKTPDPATQPKDESGRKTGQ